MSECGTRSSATAPLGHETVTAGECLFAPRMIPAIAAAFFAVWLTAWGFSRGVLWFCNRAGTAVDVPSKWPLSLYQAKMPGVHAPMGDLFVAAGVVLLFAVVVRWLFRPAVSNIGATLALAFCLLLGTNLIHGPSHGLTTPHQAEGQYFHDAAGLSSAGGFLGQFAAIQPELGCHGRTHPPGAVLAFWVLGKTVGGGAALSIALAAIAVGFSGAFFYGLLRCDFDRPTSCYVTLLFLLIPSVQIYYCATLDALVAACCLGVLFFLRNENKTWGIVGTIACLWCALWLTFGAMFLVPVVVGYEIVTRRSVRKATCIIAAVAGLFAVLWGLSAFNYIESLQTATRLENPRGFLLLAEPVSYVMTRLENVGDILIFFGPFLAVLALRGVRKMRRARDYPELFAMTCFGILSLGVLFLTGALKTGETARACLFIYPYLMLPVAACLCREKANDADKRTLLWLVFGQAVAMQTVAGFYW